MGNLLKNRPHLTHFLKKDHQDQDQLIIKAAVTSRSLKQRIYLMALVKMLLSRNFYTVTPHYLIRFLFLF